MGKASVMGFCEALIPCSSVGRMSEIKKERRDETGT